MRLDWLLEWVGSTISPYAALVFLPIAVYLKLKNYLPIKPKRHDEKDNDR